MRALSQIKKRTIIKTDITTAKEFEAVKRWSIGSEKGLSHWRRIPRQGDRSDKNTTRCQPLKKKLIAIYFPKREDLVSCESFGKERTKRVRESAAIKLAQLFEIEIIEDKTEKIGGEIEEHPLGWGAPRN
jgi:hypothetical protein